EDAAAARLESRLKLGELLRLCSCTKIPTFGVRIVVAERSAAEEPDRTTRQHGAVAAHKSGGLLQPMHGVCGATDHEGVVAFKVAHLPGGADICLLSRIGQLLGDPL